MSSSWKTMDAFLQWIACPCISIRERLSKFMDSESFQENKCSAIFRMDLGFSSILPMECSRECFEMNGSRLRGP